MLSTVIMVSFPHLLGLESQLIYRCFKEAIVRPLRQREKEKASPTNIQTLNHVPLSFSEPWPCLCRAALCKTSSSLWPPLGASTPKTWRSSSGGINVEAPLLSPATRAWRLPVVTSGSWETTRAGVAHKLLYVGLGLSGCFLNLRLSIYLKSKKMYTVLGLETP